MTIVLKCPDCKSVLLVINDETIDKTMYAMIGKAVVAGKILERYKPGDTSYKKAKFFGEEDCDACKSSTNATVLFGPDSQEEGPNIPDTEGTTTPAERKPSRKKKAGRNTAQDRK